MDNSAKLRPLYLAKILYEKTDEEHYLTTAQLAQILEEQYGITSHRQTIKADIELLKQFGLEIEEVKSVQNRYNLYGRQFDAMALAIGQSDIEQRKTYEKYATEVLKNWSKRIKGGDFYVYSRYVPTGERVANTTDLFAKLMRQPQNLILMHLRL